MRIGGVQKSLYNLLWTIKDQYDVTLYLFHNDGQYELPPNVKVISCNGSFRFFGKSQGQCKGIEKCKRGFLRLLCRFFTRSFAVKVMLLGQKRVKEHYDCAIAYLQNGNIRNLYGGVQDFVLYRVDAAKKVALLHCDYVQSGANETQNNRLIEKFDCIAACSDGCRHSFEKIMPQEKCITVRNCHRYEEIRSLANREPVIYRDDCCNVLMVTRLAHEKGVERALEAVAFAKKSGIAVRLHLVGDGAMRQTLQELTATLGIEDSVVFYGEQRNPYRFMLHADLLLMTSFYEAAPMVIEEAASLALPTLTTQTTSSREMIGQCGWICENSQEAINEALCCVLSDQDSLQRMKQKLSRRNADNVAALNQFTQLIEG